MTIPRRLFLAWPARGVRHNGARGRQDRGRHAGRPSAAVSVLYRHAHV